MKIVLIGTAYPMRGGIAHYLSLLYRYLQRRGHRVWVVSFRRQYPALFFPGRTQMDTSQEVQPIPAHPLLDSINPFSWIQAAGNIRQIDPDVVVFKYWMPFFAPCYTTVSFLVRLSGHSRVVLICDNITPHEPRPGDRLLNRLLLHCADAFIVQSEAVKQDLLSYRPDAKYQLVPHPVYEIFPDRWERPQARKQLGLPEDAPVLLFFGYVRAYKGLRHLLEAMPQVLATLPEAQLLVAGEFYEPIEPYRQLIAERGIGKAVRVIDRYVPNEEVGLLFGAADVVVLPYVSATQSGIVQIAYHYGRPVISTAVGGLPEAIEEGRTGFIVPPRDPKALAKAIIRFFQHPDQKQFEHYIREARRRFSWDRMVEAIESLATYG